MLNPEAAFFMLISDSESAYQKTHPAVGNGVDVKRNVLLNKHCSVLSETHKFKESVYDNNKHVTEEQFATIDQNVWKRGMYRGK